MILRRSPSVSDCGPSRRRSCDDCSSRRSGGTLTHTAIAAGIAGLKGLPVLPERVTQCVDGAHPFAIGIERRLGHTRIALFKIDRHNPAFAAATTSAPSVGSPTMR